MRNYFHDWTVAAGFILFALCCSPSLADYKLTTITSFNYPSGYYPYAGLIANSSNTFFYGSTSDGRVFSIADSSNNFSYLCNVPLSSVRSHLGLDSQGNLFVGEGVGAGSIYEASAPGYVPKSIANLTFAQGERIWGGLSTDAQGNIYGTTVWGGDSNVDSGFGGGTVFEVNATTHSVSVLVTFEGPNGSSSYSDLVFDKNGNAYGTAYAGGTYGYGTIFKIAAGTHAFSTVASFNGQAGTHPHGGLVMDANGNLFGSTSAGSNGSNGAWVFELPAGGSTPQFIADLGSTIGAVDAEGDLALDARGNLFGTSVFGANRGTVFEVAAGAHQVEDLWDFTGGLDGAYPSEGVAIDSSGNLYGTAWGGGSSGDGVAFELSPVPEASGATLVMLAAVGWLSLRRARVAS